MNEGQKHKHDLEYTADGIRGGQEKDWHDDSTQRSPASEQHVQASMQEETAKAMHRMAHAVEQQNETLERLAEAMERQNELKRQGDG